MARDADAATDTRHARRPHATDGAGVATADWVVDLDDVTADGGRIGAADPDGAVRVPRPGCRRDVLVARAGPEVHVQWYDDVQVLVVGNDDRPLVVKPGHSPAITTVPTNGPAADVNRHRLTQWVSDSPQVAPPDAFRGVLEEHFSTLPVGLAGPDGVHGFAWPGERAVAWTAADPFTGTVGTFSTRDGPVDPPGDAAFLGHTLVAGGRPNEGPADALADVMRPL